MVGRAPRRLRAAVSSREACGGEARTVDHYSDVRAGGHQRGMFLLRSELALVAAVAVMAASGCPAERCRPRPRAAHPARRAGAGNGPPADANLQLAATNTVPLMIFEGHACPAAKPGCRQHPGLYCRAMRSRPRRARRPLTRGERGDLDEGRNSRAHLTKSVRWQNRHGVRCARPGYGCRTCRCVAEIPGSD